MSETATTPAACDLTFEGRPVQVGPLTPEIHAFFELWMENNLSAGLERARAVNTAQVYQDRLRAGNGQLAAGDFAWGNPDAHRAAWSDHGFKELSFHCIGAKQPNWTRAEHERLCAAPGMLTRLVEIVYRSVATT